MGDPDLSAGERRRRPGLVIFPASSLAAPSRARRYETLREWAVVPAAIIVAAAVIVTALLLR